MWKYNVCILSTFLFLGHLMVRPTDAVSSRRLSVGSTSSAAGLVGLGLNQQENFIGSNSSNCDFIEIGTVDSNDPKVYACTIQNSDSQAIRISVKSKSALVNLPILFVVKQQKSVLSWAVPHIIQNKYEYPVVGHTLCPEQSNGTHRNISIALTTSSLKTVPFTLNVTQVPNFKLTMDQKISVVATPSQSQYYKFQFPDGVQSVIVRATSESKLCAVVSLQSINCPIYDQFRNVEFTGVYQTMTTQAAITVERDYFKGGGGHFFVVLVVQPDDKQCGYTEAETSTTGSSNIRNKTIGIVVEETYSSTEYWRPVLATIGLMLLFYLVTGILVFVASARQDSNSSGEVSDVSSNRPFVSDQQDTYGSTGRPSPNHVGHGGASERRGSTSSASDEDDIDYLEDIEQEKEVYRTKTVLFVSDLSRKDPKLMRMKYRLYHWNLITIAVFYALPVIQLVVTYQTVLNITGNEDICYYNFLCANPAGVISAFNNVFSNIGYMMLGGLFLLLVYRKEYLYKKELALGNRRSEKCGIPKHFGLFYALGISLFMEGVLSACYHVCPNYSNFQFDTSFMYIIAGLGMLKLYQQRHPDINANAYASYACFAGVIFIAVLGVVLNSLWFYLVYAFVHFSLCLVLSAQIYYMGQWKLDFGIFKRIWYLIRTDFLRCSKPVYTDRMVVLLIGNAVNWSLIIVGLVKQPKDFASFLLAIFIVNLLLYLMFYIIMKIRCKERIIPVAIIFLVCTGIIWIFALYFFSLGLTQWQKTPAQSREGNEECILMGFYDGHDIWHFLSAAAMFFSFMLVLVLDDDLDNKPRTEIQVF
ncbi:SID1 transmembrane family member 1-like isoform X2 [Antedon mediterranea]|uniref:SID1 transmembrane family member 1-like isoform X2 n=1 Tax=Antedon mediterranea TaxID=105859 RepID=UPI003AF63366